MTRPRGLFLKSLPCTQANRTSRISVLNEFIGEVRDSGTIQGIHHAHQLKLLNDVVPLQRQAAVTLPRQTTQADTSTP